MKPLAKVIFTIVCLAVLFLIGSSIVESYTNERALQTATDMTQLKAVCMNDWYSEKPFRELPSKCVQFYRNQSN